MSKIKIVFSVLFFLALLPFFLFVFFGPFTRISEVELRPSAELLKSKSYKAAEKKILSHLESYKGKRIWEADLKALTLKVHSIYLGASASAARKLPGRLIVFLRKKDTAALLLKDGEFFYSVSYQGDVVNKMDLEESLDFPILRGDVFWKNRPLREQALSIFSLLPEKGEGLSIENISEISYKPSNNSFVFRLIEGRFVLELPPSRLSSKKIRNIDFILNYLKQEGRTEGWIDARFDKKIIVKKRK